MRTTDILTIALAPFSWIYALVVWLRNVLYDAKLLTITQISVPVISVGNISAGGTGKTPFVELLIEMISQKGKKVAVVSRGYRRSSSGTVVVSDGERFLASVRDSGDEPAQIAKNFPGTVVIVDEQRSRGARLAFEKFKAEAILLDDGFQHRSLHRDLDIVLLDTRNGLRQRFLLPAGLRREPASSLRRAHLLVRSAGTAEDLKSDAQRTHGHLILVERVPEKMLSIVGDRTLPGLAAVKGKVCVAFCGIGNPASFRMSLDALGANVKKFLAFPDHYNYSSEDLADIERTRERESAEMILTTEKDAVRVAGAIAGDPVERYARWLYLRIAMKVRDGQELLDRSIDNVLRKVA